VWRGSEKEDQKEREDTMSGMYDTRGGNEKHIQGLVKKLWRYGHRWDDNIKMVLKE
jgi:hypothetical protein